MNNEIGIDNSVLSLSAGLEGEHPKDDLEERDPKKGSLVDPEKG